MFDIPPGPVGPTPSIAGAPDLRHPRNQSRAGLQPAASASASVQNQRSPFAGSIRVSTYDVLPGMW